MRFERRLEREQRGAQRGACCGFRHWPRCLRPSDLCEAALEEEAQHELVVVLEASRFRLRVRVRVSPRGGGSIYGAWLLNTRELLVTSVTDAHQE